jgi:hypothetical protein
MWLAHLIMVSHFAPEDLLMFVLTQMRIGLAVWRLDDRRTDMQFFWVVTWYPGVQRSNPLSLVRARSLSTAHWRTQPLDGSPLLLCDNNSAIFLAQNPVAHKRVKHIDIDYHFVLESVSAGQLRVSHVSTSLQLADIFTKGLPKPLFEFFRSKICVSVNPMLFLTAVLD